MKKETFVDLIKLLQEHYKREEKLVDIYFAQYQEYPVDRATGLIEGIVNILDEFSGEDTVSWWLFDTPNGIEGNVKLGVLSDSEGNPIDVSTPEKLYDFIVN